MHIQYVTHVKDTILSINGGGARSSNANLALSKNAKDK